MFSIKNVPKATVEKDLFLRMAEYCLNCQSKIFNLPKVRLINKERLTFQETFPLILTCVLTDTTAQKMKFSVNAFFSKYEQIRRKLRICSHLLKKSLTKNFVQSLFSVRCVKGSQKWQPFETI